MTKPKHPCPPGPMRNAFEQIAIGNALPPMSGKTREALLSRGLIVDIEGKVLPGWPPVRVRQFGVPLHHHMQWCEWCSSVVTDEDIGLGDKG